MNDFAFVNPPLAATPAEVLLGALIDSRQRWRELINLAADFAFETDDRGSFTLIAPDPALGWSVESLVGQPGAALLADGAVFDPFRAGVRVRHRPAWLKRGNGGLACLTFCTAPIEDADGRVTGVRGVGIDITERDGQAAGVAVALRRSEVIDRVLSCIGREAVPSRMIASALNVLVNALGAQGVAVISMQADPVTGGFAYVAGTGAETVADIAGRQLQSSDNGPFRLMTADARPVLFAGCRTRFDEKAGLIAWRQPGARVWDADDDQLIGSSANLVRMMLEREAMQFEMNRQARTDPLTGLLNRRAFMEEIERHAARQDRENTPGTLMFADLDNFKPVNDRLGHEAGDEVLRATAALLRKTFRPGDLVARFGGDEFAIWLNGADHMTAAERAEHLRDIAPRELAEVVGPDGPRVSLSIGIASREPGGGEPLENLMRRADRAMYEVKHGGRGHWRVSLRKRS